MFKEYDELMGKSEFIKTQPLLDSIESVFLQTPGYKDSYELGIVYNDKASVSLSMALYETKDSVEKQQLLETAKQYIDSSITLYNNWLEKYGKLSEKQLLASSAPFFLESDTAFEGKNYDKILQKRVEDLLLAQNETTRRLSVSYTNLGIILRHQYKQTEAINYYIKAIKLWKENYTARNNLNVLMGKEPEDRSIIDQLFPPQKDKFN